MSIPIPKNTNGPEKVEKGKVRMPTVDMLYHEWLSIVEENLPDLKYAIIACASASAQLHIPDIVNPVALVLKDAPSSGKTVCLNLFREFKEKVILNDEFTENALIGGQHGSKDFIGKMKDKVVLIPDLATVLHKSDDSVRSILGKLTRLLDGQGYAKASSTKETVDYGGNLFFVMIMATTELSKRVHQCMSGLGPRMIFMDVGSREPDEDVLFQFIANPKSFTTKQKTVTEATTEFMRSFWQQDTSMYGKSYVDEETQMMVARCAKAMSYMRSDITVEPDDFDRNEVAASVIEREHSWRLAVTMHNMCKAHACLRRSEYIEPQDLQIIYRCLFSSGPKPRPSILKMLIHHDGAINDKELAKQCGLSQAQAKRELYVLSMLKFGIIKKDTSQREYKDALSSPAFSSSITNEWIDNDLLYEFEIDKSLQWLCLPSMKQYYSDYNIL